MNELKYQLINEDVEVVVDTNDLIGKKILGVFDDDAAFGYAGRTLTLIVTEDKLLYINILEDDYDGIRRTHLTEDRLMVMVASDYPDMEIINFLIKFGIVDEEKYNVYRENRKLEIERKKNEADYNNYLKLKERYEER